ncbi:hypothetical protein [Brachyspira murdochii]|uniref:hypothetical protein n=1 Tax=Brachyspira murdochii TaxID=84378 RepID=UPI0012F4A2C8|nr:hypothetical protein [Brachyspira murdochii]
MEQPEEYNTERELLDWLCYDLNKQRENIAKEFGIKPEEVEDIYLTINIGDNNNHYKINFYFDFINLLRILFPNKAPHKYIFNLRVRFININFYKEFDIQGIDFKNYNVLFINCSFYKNIIFINNSFYGLYFQNIYIYESINIVVCKASDLSFSNIKFDNNNSSLNIIGNYCFIDTVIMVKSLYIGSYVHGGKINLKNLSVEKINFENIFIHDCIINPVNFKVHKFANRESALFLKQQAYASNNAIDALQYKSKEIELHKEELRKKENKTYKDLSDILSIELSSLYSDNGQNWVRALFITILITAFCFTVFYMPDLSHSNIELLYYKKLFPELIKYFIPTDYSLLIKYAESQLNLCLKIFGCLVYFLGKVLFWYGSVQTVQAFRKFSKGA